MDDHAFAGVVELVRRRKSEKVIHVIVFYDHAFEDRQANDSVERFGAEDLRRVREIHHVGIHVRERQISNLQLRNLRLARVHSLFANALAVARVGDVQAELLRHIGGNGDAARASIEQEVERTSAIEARFDEDAIVNEIERQSERSLGVGCGGGAVIRGYGDARAKNQEDS